MQEEDLGRELLSRLREQVGAGWTEHEMGFEWSLGGTAQRAWSELSTGADGWPTWRLQLRTPALEGFSGSPAQIDALSAEPPVASLAGLTRRAGQPTQLDLASSLDVRCGSVGWALWLLAVTGRLQAAEARRLSLSKELAAVGLAPAVDLAAETPSLPPRPEQIPIGEAPPPVQGSDWSAMMSECVDALRTRAQAQAILTPWGLTATLAAGGEGERSILEVKADARHPLLGKGLSVELWTPFREGLLQALTLNEREVGPRSRGDALGGWWVAEADLVHGSFHPAAFNPKGFGVELMLAYARRAREAHEIAARQGPNPGRH